MKQVWDRDRIINTLRQLHREGKDISYNRLASRMQSLVSAAAYHFGSYREAVRRAGMNYADVARRPRWTKPAIVRVLKQARRNGEDLHWSSVTRRRDEVGKAAFASLQKRLFGSWDRALRAAGLDAEEIARYRKWDRAAIVRELKQRSRRGKALNSGAMQKEDPGVHAAAVRHFGSYDRALRAAGLDPVALRQRRRWTRPDVLRELKRFSRQHKGLSDAQLRHDAPALYGAALRFFGTLTAARRAVERRS